MKRIISFVIPCYGSEKTIVKVIDEIFITMKWNKLYDFEIILVNDCSPDNVYNVIKKSAEKNKKIKVIDLARNFGQHSALMAGYSNANGEIIVSLDDDGQSPVSDVMKLVEKIEDGFDVVIAKHKKKRQSVFKNFGSLLNDKMANVLLGKPKDLKLSSFYAMKAFIVKEITIYNNPYPYIDGLILRSTNNIINVELENRSRIEGQSTYNLKKLVGLWLNGFTAFSIKPLRISMLIGVLFAIMGFILGIYSVINKFISPDIPMGWSSTMAFLAFLGGVILMVLGMIGEYVGRIYISINNSPQYVIRDTINLKEINGVEEKEYEYQY